MKKKLNFFAVSLILFSSTLFGQANQTQELVTNIKTNLGKSKQALQQYSWIETQTVFYKGEQKTVKQYQCYYSVDGKLQKVETGGSSDPEKKKRGIKGKIAEDKKDNITDYVEKAVELVKTYRPPDPAKLQKIYAAGGVSVGILVPNEQFKLSFPNYNLPGDQLSISINKKTQLLIGINVSSYIEKAEDKVIFNITYGVLPDGTEYAKETTLEATDKDIKIVMANSGYTKGKP